MKHLSRLTSFLSICAALTLTVRAGTETISSGKEMKQVAPAPMPECNWTGFYIGLHVGGQFGHAETVDEDVLYSIPAAPRPWGYDQSGVVAGGTLGYNFQWGYFVTGPEIDLGYMNADGRGANPESKIYSASDYTGRSDSDFYATFRGRIGFALGDWLLFATGGGIALNWETSAIDDCDVSPCNGYLVNAHKEELDWGWTVGGGIERRFGCHWSIKAEYLYYALSDQDFSGEASINSVDLGTYHYQAHDQGHIIRAGLNYKF